MGNIRIYELAKELGLSNKDVLDLCEQLGLKGKSSHSNTLGEDEANKIRRSVIRQAVSEKKVGAHETAIEGGFRTERRVGDIIRRRKSEGGEEGASEPTRKLDLTDAPKRSFSATDHAPDYQVEKSTREKALRDADALFRSKESNFQESDGERAPEEFSGDAGESSEQEESGNLENSSDRATKRAGGHEGVESDSLSEPEVDSLEIEEQALEALGAESGVGKDGSLEEVRRRHDIRAPRILGKIELPQKPAASKREVTQNNNSNLAVAPFIDDEEVRLSKKGARKRVVEAVVEPEDLGALEEDPARLRKKRKQILRKDDLVDYEGTREHWRTKRDKKSKHSKASDASMGDGAVAGPGAPKASKRMIKIDNEISVGELARVMGTKVGDVITHLINLGTMATINQLIDLDTASIVAGEFGYTVVNTGYDETEFLATVRQEDKAEDLLPRPPVVTVMGHVDHGKTSLLDAIRKTSVTTEEAGGITQHIGAYNVSVPTGGSVTFLDTPGHEAFTAMRSRGVNVTDIVVLVVAADDGVMPQTVEAINHARAANVPIIVAMNKMDKPSINPDRVINQLAEHELIPEEWGGKTQYVRVSAHTKEGLDKLLESLHAQSEIMELRANPNRAASGSVIESELDRGRGPVITVLVKNGTLRPGDIFVTGPVTGKVRALVDHDGKSVQEIGPGMPAEVLGAASAPAAGDDFLVVSSETEARTVAEERARRKRLKELAAKHQIGRLTLESLSEMVATNGPKELAVIVKADVQGSVEAVSQALVGVSDAGVTVNVLHQGVGAITENDVQLALASRALVIGFNVRANARAATLIEHEKVDVKYSRVIYELVDAVRAVGQGLLDPTFQEKTLGHVEVRQIFKVGKLGTIAGSFVLDGVVQRGSLVRLMRDSVVIFEGKLSSLKRFKDDVREVQSGYECGIALEGYNDIRDGDVLEVYKIEEVAR